MRWLFVIISTVLTVGLVAYVIQSLELGSLEFDLSRELILSLAATAPFYAVVLGLRGGRIAWVFRGLKEGAVGLGDGAQIAAIHSLSNHLMPFRLGESVFVIVSRFVFRIPLAKAAGVLFVLRLYDVVALLFLGAIGWTWLRGELYPLALAVALLVVAARLDWVLSLAGALLERISERTRRLAPKLRDGARAIRSPRFVAVAFCSSLAIWSAQAVFFASIWWAVGEPIAPDLVLVPTAITNLAGFIPASALGTFGPLEAGWTAGFVFVGMDRQTAALNGILMHLVVVLTCMLLSAVFVLRTGPKLWRAVEEWRRSRNAA
ncbi:MAG: lysylphosphatidylglycerol synthase domain-containing protein [Myxococcota bacterium]